MKDGKKPIRKNRTFHKNAFRIKVDRWKWWREMHQFNYSVAHDIDALFALSSPLTKSQIVQMNIYVLQQSSKLNGTQHTHDSAKVIARNSVLWHRTHTQRKYRKRWQRENKHGKKRMHDTLNGISILTFDAHKFIVKSTHTHTHAQLFHCSKAISMHSDNWQFSAANRIWRSNQRYFFSLSLIVYIYIYTQWPNSIELSLRTLYNILVDVVYE